VVKLDILHNGQPMTVEVTLAERPSNLNDHAELGSTLSQGTLRGISVQALTPDLRQQFGLPSDIQGVAINNLDPTSPAVQSGLQQGDVIEGINHQPVRSVADFGRLAAQAQGDTLVRINRQGTGLFIVVSPSAAGGDDNGQ